MQKIKFEYKITAIYLVLGCLWILFSDKILLLLIDESHLLTKLQTYKGWFYVLVTGILFYFFLKKHLVKIRNAEQKAIENDRLKTAFIQNISHEIRTPMNGIIGFAELLDDDNISSLQKKQYLEIITKSSAQLLTIVNEILDISLIDSGSIMVHENEVSINKMLDEVYVSNSSLFKKEVAVTLHKGLNDRESRVSTDTVKVIQVLNNLLSNATKYTDTGFISFGYSLNGNELEFFVSDSGIGIDEEIQTRIFERFYQAEKANTKLYPGIGLGLAICKGNIDLLKGRIWLKSRPYRGSDFFFTIPYKPVNARETVHREKNETLKELRNLTILIVEDEETNFQYISEIFDISDIKIIRAINGKAAVDVCRENNGISLVLMDMKMPGMDGYEATKLIREFRPDIPIIAQTAYALSDEKEAALNAGCNEYISKPFKKEQLLSLVSKVISG
jgi:signal transduction histidine kinase